MDTPASRKVSLVLNFAGTLCQLLMFTYSCDDLIQESVKVGNAIFSGPWASLPMDEVGRVLRKNLVIVIMRSHRVCCLTAGKFFPVSLETSTAVITAVFFLLVKQIIKYSRVIASLIFFLLRFWARQCRTSRYWNIRLWKKWKIRNIRCIFIIEIIHEGKFIRKDRFYELVNQIQSNRLMKEIKKLEFCAST